MTIEKDESFLSSIEEICSPKSACRFLRAHSGIGNDRDHTNEQLALFETLNFDQLTIIVQAAFETAKMIMTLDTIDQILSDEEIDRRLKRNGMEIYAGKFGREKQQGETFIA